ncbi:hypothetical protein HNR76_000652 [Pseudoxanthomonas broegbernensis]|nr:hypothetical protein [Pseudoxanthomonas broegbernensis]
MLSKLTGSRSPGKALPKGLHVAGHAAQRRLHPLRGVVHLHAGLHRALGLLHQVGRAAVPELGDVEHRVEHRRRIARPLLPAVADGNGYVVRTAGADVVAGVATDDVAARQARIEEQPRAQFDLLGGDGLAAHFADLAGHRLEQDPGGGAQRLRIGRGGRRLRRRGAGGERERAGEGEGAWLHGGPHGWRWCLLYAACAPDRH